MKVMFYSPHALSDSCSGAAKCMQTLLEELVELGHDCIAVTGTIVDGHSDLFAKIIAAPPTETLQIENSAIEVPLRRLIYNGVEHLVIGAVATPAATQKAYMDAILKTVFSQQFDRFAPDVVLTYGGFSSNFFAGQYARMRGRRVALFAASGSYDKPSHFVHVQLVATVSTILSAHVAKTTSLPIVTLKPFVRRSEVIATRRDPRFITFINPSLGKGIKLVAALAAECQRLGRPYKFLFIESRATRETALRDCPDIAQYGNITFAANTADISAIYAQTRILLFPSVWQETAGRVAIEANANGIPVLASNIGGIPEMLDGAGYLFNPPEDMVRDWATAPPRAYVEQWLEVLDRLHHDPNEHANATARARAADQRYDTSALARRLAAVMGNRP